MGTLNRRPILRATDTDFVKELKLAVMELYDDAARNRLQGDQATFFITQGPGGRTGHSRIRRVAVAVLTTDNGDGSYDAEDQVWDSGWASDPDGRTYGGSDYPALEEVNGTDGIDTGTYVLVFEKVADDGVTSYFFEYLPETDDRLVTVSAVDTTPGELNPKWVTVNTTPYPEALTIAANGTPLSKAILNAAADEKLLATFGLATLAAGGTLIGTELLLTSTDGAVNTNRQSTVQQIIDLLDADDLWIQIVANVIGHKVAVTAESDAEYWKKWRVYDSGGGVLAMTVDGAAATDVTIKTDVNGHIWELNGVQAPGGTTKSQYRICGGSTIIYRENTVTNAVIELDYLYCYEYIAAVVTGVAANTDTITNTYSNPGACAACGAAQSSHLWRKCSDDSQIAIFTDGSEPDDDYAWVYDGSAYQASYADGMTTDTPTDPCWVGDPSGTPTQCSDVTAAYASDAFGDNSFNLCRWAVVATAGTGGLTEQNGVLEGRCTNVTGVSQTIKNRLASKLGTDDFSVSVDLTNIAVSSGGTGSPYASIDLTVQFTDNSYISIRKADVNGTKYVAVWGGSIVYNGADSSTSGELSIVRSGSN